MATTTECPGVHKGHLRLSYIAPDLAKHEPGDALSAGLLDRAKSLVQSVAVEEWARKDYHSKA
jgi:hypothetical protein